MKIMRQSKCGGFTLVELMGAVVISMIVILLLYKIFDKVQTVFVVSQNRARAMEQGRIAMDMIVNDIEALSPARINDLIGEVPNIDWVGGTNEVNSVGYLSPVRPFYIESIDNDSGVLQVGGAAGPAISDTIYFPDSLNKYGVGKVINAAQGQFTYMVSGNDSPYNPFLNFKGLVGAHEPPVDAKRAEVHMTAIPYSRWLYYHAMSQDLFRHHCRFFTNDEGWRFVDYKFGGKENYKRMDPASPVGALWVYRSRVVPLSGLLAEREDHEALKRHDSPGVKLDEPIGYARVMNGVIHFRLRAISPADPGRALASPVDSFFTGNLAPTFVEVELAVVDEKLMLELEQEVEQRMEGETNPAKKYHAKLKHLSENLDRVYFYKQLIRILGEGQK